MPARPSTWRELLQSVDPRFLVGRLAPHRHLLKQLVTREIQSRYRGALLGVGWTFIHPVLLLVVYTFVFRVVLDVRWPQLRSQAVADFAAVLFCGMIVFTLFSECVGRAPGLVLGSPGYVKKVAFPLQVLPVVVLGSACFHAAASLVVLLVVRAGLGHAPPATVLLVPVVALPLVMLSLGLGYLFASLGVFVRDIGQVIQLLLQALIFLTPVFYPLEALPQAYRPIIGLNPLTPIVDDVRRVVLWGLPPDWARLVPVYCGSLAVLLLGFSWFHRTERAFADVV